jgi:CRISPR/Cas system-associated endoribonuclease Cas2
MKRTILAITLIAAGAGGAHAYGSSTRDIDAIQAREAARIQQGIRNGSITRSEAAQLKAEQRRIEHLESRAKADGHISRSEHDQIRAAQARANHHITRESHDSERRGWRRWWW